MRAELVPARREVELVLAPHPLRREVIHAAVPEGTTLGELGVGNGIHAVVDGMPVSDIHYMPRPGQVVLLQRVCAGDDKGVFRLVATIAIIALASYAAGALTAKGALLAGTSETLVFSGLALAGQLALYALIPPPDPNLDRLGQFEPFRALAGSRNRLALFEPVPRILGKQRMFPPYAARPSNTIRGKDDYFRGLFCVGYGPLDIDRASLKIGDALLSTFEEVTVQVKDGFTNNDTLTLVDLVSTNPSPGDLKVNADAVIRTTPVNTKAAVFDVHTAPFIAILTNTFDKRGLAIGLTFEYRAAGTIAPWVAIEPTVDSSTVKTQYVSNYPVDLDFNGFAVSNSGSVVTPSVTYAGPTYGPAMALLGQTEQPAVASLRVTFPAVGQYDVRITRRGWVCLTHSYRVLTSMFHYEGDGRSNVIPYDDFVLFRTRSILNAGQALDSRYAYIALEVRATTQLSGTIDQLSCVAQSVLPTLSGTYSRSGTTVTVTIAGHGLTNNENVLLDFTSGGATDGVYPATVVDANTFTVSDTVSGVTSGAVTLSVPTSNPAWCFRDVLRGPANAKPAGAAKVNTAGLEAWAIRAAGAGREFNGVFDGRTTVYEALKSVAAVGRAAFSRKDGTFSVVEDRTGLTPVQMFTPRNMWDFEMGRAFPKLPHALKVKFRNRDADWAEDERIVFDDGYSLTGSGCEVPGPAGACAPASRFESMSLFGVTHKDQAWKDARFLIASGTLRSETFTWKCAIENLIAQRGDVVRVQHDAILVGLGSGRVGSATTTSITLDEEFTVETGKTYEVLIRDINNVVLTRAVTNAAGTSKTLTFVTPITVADVVGGLAAFGETGLSTLDLLLVGVRPLDNMTAEVSAVPYSSPAVHNAESGAIPAYNPNVTLPAQVPAAPAVISIVSDVGVGERTMEGAIVPQVNVAYANQEATLLVQQVEVQFADAAQGTLNDWQVLYGPPTGTVSFKPPVLGTYKIRLRAWADNGLASAWTPTQTHVVGAQATSTIATLTLSELPNTPATPDGRNSTVRATITPPGSGAWSFAILQMRKQGTADWMEAGRHASQVDVVLVADRSVWEFRLVDVSQSFVETVSPDAPLLITLKNLVGSPPNGSHIATYLPASNVANLKLANAAGTSFSGRDAVFEWDNGAVPAYLHFKDYRVRIYRASDMVLLRIEYVTAASYTYTGEMNALDNGGSPVRGLVIDVVQRTLQLNVGS